MRDRGGIAVALIAAVVGAVLVVLHWPAPSTGTQPPRSFHVPEAEPRGPTSTPAMSPADMDPGTIFIPELEAYAPLTPMATSNDTLEIPPDPTVVGWDELTPALSAAEGSTFLAGHVQAQGRDGVLHDLPQLQAGALIYTRDEVGELREWVVTALDTSRGKQMLPEHFTTSGERRLTLVTCTGPLVTMNGRTRFRDSVIVTALPHGS